MLLKAKLASAQPSANTTKESWSTNLQNAN